MLEEISQKHEPGNTPIQIIHSEKKDIVIIHKSNHKSFINHHKSNDESNEYPRNPHVLHVLDLRGDSHALLQGFDVQIRVPAWPSAAIGHRTWEIPVFEFGGFSGKIWENHL
jgi:hypothetical protein